MPPTPQRSPLLLFLLKYPLFILIAVVIAGIAAWRFMREPGPPGMPIFTAPTEAHRPALKAAFTPALKTFYSTPNATHRFRAIHSVRDYRRSFANATSDDLTDPTQIPPCNVRLECTKRDQELEKTLAAAEDAIAKQFAHLPKDSPEQRAAITEAYALDRRFRIRTVTDRIDWYFEAAQKEPQLLKLQADFFRIIDETAVPENYQTSHNSALIYEYLAKYFELSQRSLKSIPRLCEGGYLGDSAKNPAACKAAIAEYEAFERRHRDEFDAYWRPFAGPVNNPKDPQHQPFLRPWMAAKAVATKKVLADREAPQQFIRWRMIDNLRR